MELKNTMPQYKILGLSDSSLTTTGYATVAKDLFNILASKPHWECHVLGHNYLGQTLVPPVKFEDGTALNYKLWGCGREYYAKDIMEQRIKEIGANIFWILLDSLTEERCIPILNKRGDIEILPFKELYDRYREMDGIKTLSVKYIPSRKSHKIVTEWKTIRGIERRFVHNHPIRNISQKHGNTRTTEKHSLKVLKENQLIDITPDEIKQQNLQLLNIGYIPFKERKYAKDNKYFDFIDYLDLKIFDYDNEFIWLRNKYDCSSRLSRFLDKNELESFIIVIGAYVSEGCISAHGHNYGFIISNNDRKWLLQIKEHMRISLKKGGILSNKISEGKTYNLVCFSELLYNLFNELCGKGSRNKKLPAFVYDLNESVQTKLLNTMIKGDGSFYPPYEKLKNRFSNKGFRFSYTTISLRLASGICFLLKQMRIKYNILYNPFGRKNDEKKRGYLIYTNIKDIKRGKTWCKKEKYTGYIYDICVEDNENFVDCCGMIVCKNTFMLYPWLLQKNFAPAKSVFYFPSDGGMCMPSQNNQMTCAQILEKVDMPVAMSRYGQKQVKDIYGIKTEHIPHAVHTDIYYPLSKEEKERLRQETIIFNADGAPIKGAMQGKFIIGSVFRNQPRKMVDRMLKTFAILLRKYKFEDFIFLAHTDPEDAAAAFSITEIAQEYGIKHKIFFTGMRFFKGFSVKQLNEVYNMMDVFFLSTSGEGFGIPTLEAASAGIPSVVTDYTSTPELLIENGKCGEPVKLVGTDVQSLHELMFERNLPMRDIDAQLHNGTITGAWMVERGLMDCDDAAQKLLKLAVNPSLREQYAKNGRDKALNIYDWKIIGEKWDALLKKLVEQ